MIIQTDCGIFQHSFVIFLTFIITLIVVDYCCSPDEPLGVRVFIPHGIEARGIAARNDNTNYQVIVNQFKLFFPL